MGSNTNYYDFNKIYIFDNTSYCDQMKQFLVKNKLDTGINFISQQRLNDYIKTHMKCDDSQKLKKILKCITKITDRKEDIEKLENRIEQLEKKIIELKLIEENKQGFSDMKKGLDKKSKINEIFNRRFMVELESNENQLENVLLEMNEKIILKITKDKYTEFLDLLIKNY
jgi:hypothetical protein